LPVLAEPTKPAAADSTAKDSTATKNQIALKK
jgi:hypothetical protein